MDAKLRNCFEYCASRTRVLAEVASKNISTDLRVARDKLLPLCGGSTLQSIKLKEAVLVLSIIESHKPHGEVLWQGLAKTAVLCRMSGPSGQYSRSSRASQQDEARSAIFSTNSKPTSPSLAQSANAARHEHAEWTLYHHLAPQVSIILRLPEPAPYPALSHLVSSLLHDLLE